MNVYKSSNSLAHIACPGAMSRSNSTFHSFCHSSGLACCLTAIIVEVRWLVLCQWIRNRTNWKTRISTVTRLINSAVLLCTDLLASQCLRDIVKTQEGCTPQCTSRPTFTRLCAKATRIGQLASCTPRLTSPINNLQQSTTMSLKRAIIVAINLTRVTRNHKNSEQL